MTAEIQDAVALAIDPQIRTQLEPKTVPQAILESAIEVTTEELKLVRELLRIRGGKDQRLISDELEVLARLADLKVQAVRK